MWELHRPAEADGAFYTLSTDIDGRRGSAPPPLAFARFPRQRHAARTRAVAGRRQLAGLGEGDAHPDATPATLTPRPPIQAQSGTVGGERAAGRADRRAGRPAGGQRGAAPRRGRAARSEGDTAWEPPDARSGTSGAARGHHATGRARAAAAAGGRRRPSGGCAMGGGRGGRRRPAAAPTRPGRVVMAGAPGGGRSGRPAGGGLLATADPPGGDRPPPEGAAAARRGLPHHQKHPRPR